MKRFAGLLALGAALIVPASMFADDHDHDRDRHERRYYDRDRRDYHQWNDREDNAYRHYLQERNREYREWNRAKGRDQRDYWRWRHEHQGPQFEIRIP